MAQWLRTCLDWLIVEDSNDVAWSLRLFFFFSMKEIKVGEYSIAT